MKRDGEIRQVWQVSANVRGRPKWATVTVELAAGDGLLAEHVELVSLVSETIDVWQRQQDRKTDDGG